MFPRLILRLASLLSLGLVLLPLGGTAPGPHAISETERELLLAHLDESWAALHGPGGGLGERESLESLRLRMRKAASLEEALRVLSELMRAASRRPEAQGQDTPEASISASRTPTWLPPARF